MTRLSNPVDLQDWMARIEERLRTVENRVNQTPRPPAPVGTALFGPNVLPNPTFESGLAGWLVPSNGFLTGDALQGTRSLVLQHTSTQQTVRTRYSFEAPCTAIRSYDVLGNPLPDVSSWGYQGDYGSPFGIRSSLHWVDHTVWAGAVGLAAADIDTLEVGVDWNHWYQSMGGVAVIGLNTVAAIPSVGDVKPATGWTADIFRTTWEGRYMFKWLNLRTRTPFVDAIRAGTLRGIALGPTPAGQQYYGYTWPNTKIRGSYYKTEVISSNALQSTVWGEFQSAPSSTVWQVSWLVRATCPAVAHIGIGHAVNSTDSPTVIEATTLALTPNVTARVTGTTTAIPGSARFVAPYITVVGDPPVDGGSGLRVPWTFTVDDATLRQKVGGA